jgi:hypothetical protein
MPEVKVKRVGNGVDYEPKGLTKVKRGETMTWKNEGNSLEVDFAGPRPHPFESAPPFKAGPKGRATATVRMNAESGEYPCRLKVDDLPFITVPDGVIIE